MNSSAASSPGLLRLSHLGLVAIGLAVALAYVTFKTGVDYSAVWIWTRPEYGHGLLIPFIAAFLIWQRRAEIATLPFTGSWAGVTVLAAAVLVNLVGKMASLFIIQQYAAVAAIYGLTLALVGWNVFRRLWVPLLILLFMVPLPEFLYKNLSASLQLISSQIGVWFIRLFGISVFVEGNVIDLGIYKLQVAEACDGLRYLFPLMTLGFIVAYFFKAALWKRIVLFLSSIPITILMNSFRIGTIGVMVEHWGISMAEGFLHDFQGWVVFMASVAIMLLEMMALSRIGRESENWRRLFGIELPAPYPTGTKFATRPVPAALYAVCALLAVSTLGMLVVPERAESVPSRSQLTSFPLKLEGWQGRSEPIERVYLDELKLDDYLMANFVKAETHPVNFYVAWYDSQRAGRSAHSPRSCLPGGGWEIRSLTQVEVPDVLVEGRPLRVNRALIQLGSQKQLVYYWFQQRGRVVTNEYLVKWYMFWDSLTRNRTDGALVRMIVPLSAADSEAEIEGQLVEFAAAAAKHLDSFVPG
jgi:exosortase D (VPLPA-CTERM-specific)